MKTFKEFLKESLNKIPGGISDKMSLEDIAKKHNVTLEKLKDQLNKGIKIEMEHTTDEEIAKEIAKDHLAEFPDYYDGLEDMEIKLEENISESVDSSKKDIIQFVEKNSYFEYDSDDEDVDIVFSTRENGNVGDETPGQIDIKEAQKLAEKIRKKWQDVIVDVEIVDEWVYVNITNAQ